MAHFEIATRVLTPKAPLPAYVLGTALPDLLPLAECRVRLRPERLASETEFEAALAAGVSAHLATDAVFHKTPAFAAAQAEVSRLLTSAAFDGMRVRRFFVAHVLTEMALDAALLRADPALADRFYNAFAAADLAPAAQWTEKVTARPLPRFPEVLARFVRFPYLREYANDDGVATGLSNLCRRAGQDTFEGRNFVRLIEVARETAARLPEFIPALLSETAAGIRGRDGEHGLHLGSAADEGGT